MRDVEYTITNLQHWVLVCYELDTDFYIICDNQNLKKHILEKVCFKDIQNVKFLESKYIDTYDIINGIATKR